MSNYMGQRIFMGIDVHKHTYSLTAVHDGQVIKRVRLRADSAHLINFCDKFFPGASITSAYEAGFSGFHLHRNLIKHGINNLIVHPAGIEVASRERVKTDKRDSQKIAVQLAAGRLKGINIPSREREIMRELTRLRETFVRQRGRVGNQTKSLLLRQGLLGADDNSKASKAMMNKLLTIEHELAYCIKVYASEWLSITEKIEEIDKQLSLQAETDTDLEKVYRSAPGVGKTSARILANELGDMSQFPNVRALQSYVGVTPREYSSGPNVRLGHISKQGKSILRKILTQAAWKAIKIDPTLNEAFERISQRAGKKRAIIAVARRLIVKIRSCFMNKCEYQRGI